MSTDSCPVCYERFTDAPSPHEARLLSCSHILCAQCISSELIDECFYCTECGAEHRGASLDAITCHPNDLKSTNPTVLSTNEVAIESNGSSSGRSGNGGNETFGFDLSWITGQSGNSDLSKRPTSLQRTRCKYPECSHKSLHHADGYCLEHAKNLKSSIASLKDLAMDITMTGKNLDMSMLTDGSGSGGSGGMYVFSSSLSFIITTNSSSLRLHT